jgi:hypothetical protein
MRAIILSALLSVGALAVPAMAEPALVHDGQFAADVSARNITRIAIAGEKVVTVRKADDAQGPKMSVDVDAGTGDVFVEFDGDVAGRTFTAFLTTQSGRTVEAVLSPRVNLGAGEGQTVVVQLGADPASRGPVQAEGGDPDAAAPPVQGQADRHEGYPEVLTALIRLMFNDARAPGVDRQSLSEPPKSAGPFQMQAIETFTVGDLKGTVLSLRNTTRVGQPLNARTFLVTHVLAAAVSHETVAPGQLARIYIVEGAAQ